MNFVDDFQQNIELVFQSAEHIISTYPSPFHKQGIQYLSKFNPLKENSKKNYICYLLPFWIKDIFSINEEKCRELALGNIFAMLHFFIQDDLIDSKVNNSNEHFLSLSNLFYMSFLEMYQSILPSNTNFWNHYKQYLYQWVQESMLENNHELLIHRYSQNDLTVLAQKSAPLKITVDVMGILGKSDNLVSTVNELIDKILIVLQLLDDWQDWEDDLHDRNCTYFLYCVMKYNNLDTIHSLNSKHINKAVYMGNILSEIFSIVNELWKSFQSSITAIDIPYLKDFFDQLLIRFDHILLKIKEEQIRIIKNGIYSIPL